MLRFDIKLLPIEEAANEADAKVIEKSNQDAMIGFRHLKKLLRGIRCKKHPASPNKIRVFAVKGQGPRADMVSFCCTQFLQKIK